MPKRNKDRCALGNYRYILRENGLYWLEYKAGEFRYQLQIDKRILLHVCTVVLFPELPTITLPKEKPTEDSGGWFGYTEDWASCSSNKNVEIRGQHQDEPWQHYAFHSVSLVTYLPMRRSTHKLTIYGMTTVRISDAQVKKIMEFIVDE